MFIHLSFNSVCLTLCLSVLLTVDILYNFCLDNYLSWKDEKYFFTTSWADIGTLVIGLQGRAAKNLIIHLEKNVWKSDKSWEPEKIWEFEKIWKFEKIWNFEKIWKFEI